MTVVVLHGACEEGERRVSVQETPVEVRVRVDNSDGGPLTPASPTP